MKILHLSSEKPWRGGEQQIAYLVEELDNAGVKNHVAVQSESEFLAWCIDQNIDHSPLKFSNSLDFQSAFKLKKIIKDIQPEIIHVHSSKSHGILALAYWLFSIKIPFVVSRRVCFSIKNGFFNQLKYNLKSLKKIICVSDQVIKEVHKVKGTENKTVKIYDGIDINHFSEAISKNELRKTFNLDEDDFLVGNTSALTVEKDYITFVEVAEMINQKHQGKVHFFIIGKGEEEQNLRKLVSTKKYKNNIHFTGFVQDVRNYLAELDAFLFTSTAEGLGTSVLNAFATKTPVISTNVGGLPELVLDGETGLLADAKDVRQMTTHLSRLITDPIFTTQLTQRAFESLKGFTYEKMASETLLVYKSIIQKDHTY